MPVLPRMVVDEAPPEDWEWVLNINLMGVVRGCKNLHSLVQTATPRLHHQHCLYGRTGPLPEMGSYNASKAGVVAVSETLHGELAGQGIGVSVVCPGFFRPVWPNGPHNQPAGQTGDRKLFPDLETVCRGHCRPDCSRG